MKRIILVAALLAAFGASAQDSTSNAGSNASSSSNPVVSNGSSSSSSGAEVNGVNSMSQSNPNNANAQNIVFNSTSGGASTMDSTSTNRNINEGTTTQRLEGGTNSTVRNIQEGESTQNVRYSGTQTVKNVPSIQMSGPASGPCTGVSGGIGISGPGWGVGVNGSAVMDDCRLRENTRVLGMGMQSIDGNANPQERGEATVMFMDAMRSLSAYNKTIYDRAAKEAK